MLVQVLIEGEEVLWTRDEPWGRVVRTYKADRTRWFGRALLMWHVGSNFSQNVYLPMKFTTQLVELY
jgi:hypothetical protein